MELSKLPAPTIFTVATLETVATFLCCYLLAVAYGHVQPWLPTISDLGVEAPEKYPFRLGLVLGCSLMAGEMALVYYAGKPYSKSNAALALSSAASLSLAIAVVVSEKEDSAVHGGNSDSLLHARADSTIYVYRSRAQLLQECFLCCTRRTWWS